MVDMRRGGGAEIEVNHENSRGENTRQAKQWRNQSGGGELSFIEVRKEGDPEFRAGEESMA